MCAPYSATALVMHGGAGFPSALAQAPSAGGRQLGYVSFAAPPQKGGGGGLCIVEDAGSPPPGSTSIHPLSQH